jgi:hypothetical protein
MDECLRGERVAMKTVGLRIFIGGWSLELNVEGNGVLGGGDSCQRLQE